MKLRSAIAVGLVFAIAGAVGLELVAPWIRPGIVLVTSQPPGLEIGFDGVKTSLVTPAVIEDVLLSRPHEVTLGGAQVKERTIAVPREPGKLVARVHVQLESSIGAITIESVPSGAEILVDDRPAGRTPITIGDLRLDKRHRVDLILAGHEIDQFAVLPEKDGLRFTRRLARVKGKGSPSP